MGLPPVPPPPPGPPVIPEDVIKITTTEVDWERKGREEAAGRLRAGEHHAKEKAKTDWLGEKVNKVLEALFGIFLGLVEIIFKVLGDVEKDETGQLAELTTFALRAAIPDADIPLLPVGRDKRPARSAIVRGLGEKIRNLIAPEPPAGTIITPEAGQENANRLLGNIMNLVTEEWTVSWLLDAASYHLLGRFGDLKEDLIQSLGLGRLVRLALRPYIEILIAEPVERLLRKQHPDKLFGPGEAARALARGVINDSQYFSEMAEQGWDERRARHLLAVNTKSPSAAVLGELVRLGALESKDAVKFLTDDGWTEPTAALIIELERQRRFFSIQNKRADTAIEAFGRRELLEDELVRQLGAANYTTEEITEGLALGHLLQMIPKRLSFAQARDAFTSGLISLERFRDFLVQEGYSDRDQIVLEETAIARKLSREEIGARRETKVTRKKAPNRN